MDIKKNSVIGENRIKTLVVDDELVSRKKIQKIMDTLGECEAVEGGRDAIAAFTKALENGVPFDLITLDIALPDMDGTEVLYEIREIEKGENTPAEKQVKILIVTARSDKDSIITCIQAGCDDYIVKPFNREMVIKKLEKIMSGQRISVADIEDIQASPSEVKPQEGKSKIIEEIIFRFKRGEINLPSLPKINIKFNEMINKGANLQEIADLLKQDMAISFKLISVSNSVYYRGVVENKTLGQAISRLGLNTAKRYVDAISTRALYTTKNKKYAELIEKLWEHSLSCAYASQIVSESLKLRLQDDVFTVGLLHDIGKLVLLQVIGEVEIKAKLEKEIDKIELFDTLDTHHNKFSFALLKKWGFSTGFTKTALYHNNLQEADHISQELLVVHFANLLVKSMGYDLKEKAEIDVEGAESTRQLRLDSTIVDEVKDQVNERMEEMREYFR